MQNSADSAGGSGRFVERLFDDALIIRMLVLRNLRNKYRRNPLGLMLEFLQPVVVCTAHYFYFAYAGRNVPDEVYLVFVLGGFTVWFCFSSVYQNVLKSGAGLAGVTSIPGVTMMHVYLAKTVWPFLLFIMFAYLISYPAMLLGAPIEPPDLATTVQIYGLAALLGFSFALVTNAIADVLPALAPFLKLFRWALFITSGIYNSLSTMSKLEAGFVWYNPLIHLAEYQRNAFDPGYPVFYPRLWYPELVLVGLLFFGLTAERSLTRRGRGMNNFIV